VKRRKQKISREVLQPFLTVYSSSYGPLILGEGCAGLLTGDEGFAGLFILDGLDTAGVGAVELLLGCEGVKIDTVPYIITHPVARIKQSISAQKEFFTLAFQIEGRV